MEKPSRAKSLTKQPKSWETLKIYTHKHVYVMTKWETVDHLITTFGLIVVLHMSLYTFISNNAAFIYSNSVCITAYFPSLWSSERTSQIASTGLGRVTFVVCILLSSHAAAAKSAAENVFFNRRIMCLQFFQLSPATKEWAHVSHTQELLIDKVPFAKSFTRQTVTSLWQNGSKSQHLNEPHSTWPLFFCDFVSNSYDSV